MAPKRGGGGLVPHQVTGAAAAAANKHANPGDFAWYWNIFIYVFFGVLGLLLGGLCGVFAGAGMAAIMGALIGGIFGLAVAVLWTGHLTDAINAGGDKLLDVAEPIVPSFARETAFGHDFFSILVTVHRVNTSADDTLDITKVSNFDGYVEVTCGMNPPKRTCVHPRCVYEETFKFAIRPRDKFLVFELKDQEVISDELVANLYLPVTAVMDLGFPVVKAFSLLDRRQAKVGNIILSFDWCDDFPQDRLLYLQQMRPAEFARREQLRQQALEYQTQMAQEAYAYGTFAQQSRIFSAGQGQP